MRLTNNVTGAAVSWAPRIALLAALSVPMACPGSGAPKTQDAATAQATPGPSRLDESPPAEGAGLIGTAAPEWDNEIWLQSDPLRLQDLRGQVVLLRFWTDTCPFCEASAPALAALHEKYRSRGLEVIGMYHPKPPRDEPVPSVRRAAQRLGLEFPLALDNDWKTLRKYWLSAHPRGFTSVSFLIDRRGRIRHLHPGGAFHENPKGEHPGCGPECEKEYHRMDGWIRKLLEESP